MEIIGRVDAGSYLHATKTCIFENLVTCLRVTYGFKIHYPTLHLFYLS